MVWHWLSHLTPPADRTARGIHGSVTTLTCLDRAGGRTTVPGQGIAIVAFLALLHDPGAAHGRMVWHWLSHLTPVRRIALFGGIHGSVTH